MVGQGDCPTLPAPINVLTLDGIKAVLVVLNDAERGHKCRMGPPFALLRRTRPFQPFRITYFVHRCQGVQWERDPFPFQGYWADTETTPTAACDGVLPLA